MMQRLFVFLKRPNSRNVIINTLGNYLNVAFVAFFAVILVRVMHPSQYGVLSVLLGIAYVLANVLDFGITATIYSNLPILLEGKRERVYQFLKTIFSYQSLFSIITIFLLLLTFPYLDRVFFKTGAPTSTLYITAFSILFLIWQNFVLNILFAAKKFLKANIYNNLQNLIKTIVLLLLIYHNAITVGTILFVFGIVGPFIFFLMLFLEKRDLVFVLAKSQIKREEFKFGYTFTYFIATQLFNLGGRMDLFLLSFFLLRNDVGYYGLAQKIVITIVTTVVSITQVLSPNFAKARTQKESLNELRHGLLYLLLPAGLYILLFLTPRELFHLFFTERYSTSVTLTKMLVPAFIVFTLGNLPLQFILYTVKKPGYVLFGNVFYFLIMTVGCFVLIPHMGVTAAPLVNFVAILAPVLTLSLATLYEYKKLPR